MIANLPTVSRTNLLLPCFNMICTCREKTFRTIIYINFPSVFFFFFLCEDLHWIIKKPRHLYTPRASLSALLSITFYILVWSPFPWSKLSPPSFGCYTHNRVFTDFPFLCWNLESRLLGLPHCLLLFVFLRLQPMTKSAQKRNCSMGSQRSRNQLLILRIWNDLLF